MSLKHKYIINNSQNTTKFTATAGIQYSNYYSYMFWPFLVAIIRLHIPSLKSLLCRATPKGKKSRLASPSNEKDSTHDMQSHPAPNLGSVPLYHYETDPEYSQRGSIHCKDNQHTPIVLYIRMIAISSSYIV